MARTPLRSAALYSLAVAALVRQLRVLPNLLAVACAVAALVVQALVFSSSRWL